MLTIQNRSKYKDKVCTGVVFSYYSVFKALSFLNGFSSFALRLSPSPVSNAVTVVVNKAQYYSLF